MTKLRAFYEQTVTEVLMPDDEVFTDYIDSRGNNVDPFAMVIVGTPTDSDWASREILSGAQGAALLNFMSLCGLSLENSLVTPVTRSPLDSRVLRRLDVQHALGRVLREEFRKVGEPPVVIMVGAIAVRSMMQLRSSVTDILKHAARPMGITAHIAELFGGRLYDEYRSYVMEPHGRNRYSTQFFPMAECYYEPKLRPAIERIVIHDWNALTRYTDESAQ